MNVLEKILPLSCLFISLVLFTPMFGLNQPLLVALAIHLWSYLILGLFFEIPELSLNAWCLYTARDPARLRQHFPTLKKVFKIRYFLTHIMGPCSGILAIMSGLYLVHLGKYSFMQGWLFWILIASIIGLYKGMNQHNAYVKKLFSIVCLEETDEKFFKNLASMIRCPFDQILILSEFPTYIFIYLTAVYKPAWFVTPFKDWIMQMERIFDPGLFGLLLVIGGSLLGLLFRKAMIRWSYACR